MQGKTLDGQETAVKRLSIISGRRLAEFKDEAKLTTKLQHANLVRLIIYTKTQENVNLRVYAQQKLVLPLWYVIFSLKKIVILHFFFILICLSIPFERY